MTNAFASGNTVAIEVAWEGTHTGPLPGVDETISPSGKRQTTPAVMVLDFEGDRIAENRQYFDMMSLFQQLGATPQTV